MIALCCSVKAKSRFSLSSGLACSLDDDRKDVLRDIAEYLNQHYQQYSRGVSYLLQLAGDMAVQRHLPPRLTLLENSNFGAQRGGVVYANPTPHVMHTMFVRFHREA